MFENACLFQTVLCPVRIQVSWSLCQILHCSIRAPWGVSPCSGSQEYFVSISQGIWGHWPQWRKPFSWQQAATGHSPWKGCPSVSIQPPQPQVSLYVHPVQCNPHLESIISFTSVFSLCVPLIGGFCNGSVFWFYHSTPNMPTVCHVSCISFLNKSIQKHNNFMDCFAKQKLQVLYTCPACC